MKRAWANFFVALLLTGVSCLPLGAAERKVELTVWLGVADLVPIIESAVPEFQIKYPNAKVDVVAFPLREAEKKIALALTAGTAPDLYMLIDSYSLHHLQEGNLAPAPADVTEFVKKTMFPVYQQPVTYNGQVYGVPFFWGHVLLYWNKGHFADAGIAGPPKNWTELVESSKKLAQYDSAGTLTRSGISLRLTDDSGAFAKFQIFLRQAGGDGYVQTSSGKWHNDYDNAAGRETLQLYSDLLWKYKVNSHSIQGDYLAFVGQTTSMVERDPFVVSNMYKKAPQVKFDVAAVPGYKKEGTVSYMYAMWVPRTTKNQRAAWDFAMTMMGQKYMVQMLRETGWPTCRKDLDLSTVYKDFPQYKIFMDLTAKPGYVFQPAYIGPADEIQTKFAQRLSRAWLDSSLVDNPKAIEDVMKNAAAETDSILQREGLYGK
jgi:multiple sugar transport system substrate-binding protein